MTSKILKINFKRLIGKSFCLTQLLMNELNENVRDYDENVQVDNKMTSLKTLI